jgi:hypothetical protein
MFGLKINHSSEFGLYHFLSEERMFVFYEYSKFLRELDRTRQNK